MNLRHLLLPTALLLLTFSITVATAIVVSRPKARPDTPIDDLSVAADEILALSPNVAKIEVLLAPSRPTYRIVHIADSHHLSREYYGFYEPTGQGYEAYESQVQMLQFAQLSLLCWLVDHHGLRELFQEAVYDELEPRRWQSSRDKVEAFASRLRTQIEEVEAQGKDAAGLRGRERVVGHYLERGLDRGCGWDLLVVRPFVRILAAEDRVAFKKAQKAFFQPPLSLGSEQGGAAIVGDRASMPEMVDRETALVRRLLSRSKCAVVVLGSGHDLSNAIKRLTGARCEYVRVTPKGFPKRVVRDGWITYEATNGNEYSGFDTARR